MRQKGSPIKRLRLTLILICTELPLDRVDPLLKFLTGAQFHADTSYGTAGAAGPTHAEEHADRQQTISA